MPRAGCQAKYLLRLMFMIIERSGVHVFQAFDYLAARYAQDPAQQGLGHTSINNVAVTISGQRFLQFNYDWVVKRRERILHLSRL